MRGPNRFLVYIFIVLAFSCHKSAEQESQEEIYYRYYNLEKQGWKSRQFTQKIDDISFTATEVPIIYYLLKDSDRSDLQRVDSLYESNKFERVIEFSFSQDQQKDLLTEDFTKRDYTSSVKYMAFDIIKDFYLVTSKDTIPCSGVMFERNFKVSSSSKIMLFFGGVDPAENIQLVYSDQLFNKGLLKFKFLEHILKL